MKLKVPQASLFPWTEIVISLRTFGILSWHFKLTLILLKEEGMFISFLGETSCENTQQQSTEAENRVKLFVHPTIHLKQED